VTSNFDADRWLARQLEALAERHRRGELDDSSLRREREVLERRHERMVERLDGTFELPPAHGPTASARDDDDHSRGCG
jgi:hypothetical protein